VYLSYGIHRCVNLVCGPEGEASGLLLRAGEVVDGVDTARARRPTSRADVDLARGPGRLGSALAIDLSDDGTRLGVGRLSLEVRSGPVPDVETGPRVGVSGEAGGDRYPWRFWIAGDPTVSVYRPAVRRTRARA
jgi:DNA-3-methyladenine glycosylase